MADVNIGILEYVRTRGNFGVASQSSFGCSYGNSFVKAWLIRCVVIAKKTDKTSELFYFLSIESYNSSD